MSLLPAFSRKGECESDPDCCLQDMYEDNDEDEVAIYTPSKP